MVRGLQSEGTPQAFGVDAGGDWSPSYVAGEGGGRLAERGTGSHHQGPLQAEQENADQAKAPVVTPATPVTGSQAGAREPRTVQVPLLL